MQVEYVSRKKNLVLISSLGVGESFIYRERFYTKCHNSFEKVDEGKAWCFNYTDICVSALHHFELVEVVEVKMVVNEN